MKVFSKSKRPCFSASGRERKNDSLRLKDRTVFDPSRVALRCENNAETENCESFERFEPFPMTHVLFLNPPRGSQNTSFVKPPQGDKPNMTGNIFQESYCE